MESKIMLGSVFYIDEITKRLTEMYYPKLFTGSLNTLGQYYAEIVFGKFMFLAKACNQYVGMDFPTLMKSFPNENHMESIPKPLLPRESCLADIITLGQDLLHAEPVRIHNLENGMIYFPTEDLIKAMLGGTHLLPWDQFMALKLQKH